MDFDAQLAHFPAQVLHQSNELRGGVARSLVTRATELNQLAIHSQQALPKTTRIEKKWTCFHYGKRTVDDRFGEALLSIGHNLFSSKIYVARLDSGG